ncbi:hypothetical protein H0H92_008129 [Tricholoma furcatifolium]|nr:hypothetical protein H0H92_008129 [Tricholoma furcatifolium]
MGDLFDPTGGDLGETSRPRISVFDDVTEDAGKDLRWNSTGLRERIPASLVVAKYGLVCLDFLSDILLSSSSSISCAITEGSFDFWVHIGVCEVFQN